MFGLDLHVLGHERIAAKLTPALVKVPAMGIVRDAAAYALRETSAGVPTFTGASSHSFVSQIRGDGLSAKIRPSRAYAKMATLEYGRHAGRALPPPRALRAWAAAHGMTGLEFVLARAIARRGVKGRFFMRRAKDKVRSHELPRLIDRARRQILSDWRG